MVAKATRTVPYDGTDDQPSHQGRSDDGEANPLHRFGKVLSRKRPGTF
ncbi:MAG: hypothetical protein ABI690_06885 [Chloroflexota bacterium]